MDFRPDTSNTLYLCPSTVEIQDVRNVPVQYIDILGRFSTAALARGLIDDALQLGCSDLFPPCYRTASLWFSSFDRITEIQSRVSPSMTGELTQYARRYLLEWHFGKPCHFSRMVLRTALVAETTITALYLVRRRHSRTL